MFKEGKKYKFSFRKLQEDYAKKNSPVGTIMKQYDGANIKVSKDLTQGIIHGNVITPGQVVELNGMQFKMGQDTREVCLLVDVAWCEEV